MSFINIDFETRSRLDLKKVGAYVYANHESTSVLCLAYDLGDFEKVKCWEPSMPMPQDLLDAVAKGQKVKAHNAEFEFCVWNYTAVKKLGWPKLLLENLYCSLAQASTQNLPRSLAKLAIALKAPVLKDETGRAVMLRLSKPKKPSKKDPSEWDNDPEKFKILYEYCRGDVLVEKLCSTALNPISPFERKVYLLTQKINMRGVYCDVELCKTALLFLEKNEKDLNGKLAVATDGKITAAKQNVALCKWFNDNGLDIENLTKPVVLEASLRKDLSKKTRDVLDIRMELGRSSTSKYKAMVLKASEDKRIRCTLLYHGASTGRWSGRGIQPQNLPRGIFRKPSDLTPVIHALALKDYELFKSLFPSVTAALSSSIRGMLRAAPGHRLICADYNAIEVRVLMWLCDCKVGLDAFINLRPKQDIYTDMASKIYKRNIYTSDKTERAVGKEAVLGAGYGMGHKKFKITVESRGLVMSSELAKTSIETYREGFSEVPNYWRKCEEAMKTAIKLKKPIRYKNLVFFLKGDFLYIQLPSGRRISYYKPSLKQTMKWGYPNTEIRYMAENSVTKKFERHSTYGGSIVENICQSVARDILAEAMLRLDARGYEIVMSVHDEVVCEVKKGFGSLEEMILIMGQVPEWATGCPLALEGFEAKRYRK